MFLRWYWRRIYFFHVFDQKKNSFLVLSHEWRTKITSKTASSLFSVCRVEASWQGYPTMFVTNRWIFSSFFTFTLYTLVLTPMCPSPSPMLSRAYFHWNDCKPKSTWLGSGVAENHSSVSTRFVTSIVVQLPRSFFLLFGAEGNSKLFTLLAAGEQEDLWYSGRWMAWLVRAVIL